LGAYTAVDKAESEWNYLIYHQAVNIIAEYAKDHQVKLIHVSTDYVFDGTSPLH
jgi:dTDP-4-dehydrorhamnose reductase